MIAVPPIARLTASSSPSRRTEPSTPKIGTSIAKADARAGPMRLTPS